GVEAIVAALDSPNPGFKGTPLYNRIADAYRGGAGMLVAADFAGLNARQAEEQGFKYFVGEQKEVRNQMELRATLAFQGERTGIAAWLASPAPMGALDYVSPDATIVAGFVVKDPKAIIDQIVPLGERLLGPAPVAPENAAQIKEDLQASL